ncbi:hypothetical protein [Cellulomonas sp. PhB150]|uniref:hypothetical protein n=1 Tax=Cellulomonas sp. PhB150 TaxID=2485188 RepID=UPI0011CE5F3F|nr:hypothetical protein [Cellulomonas sp. PhB150]
MGLLAVVSLLAIPALIEAGGPTAWGAIATGQSVGAVAAIALYLGWGISGPASVARASDADRGREYAEALVARAVIVVPVLAATAGVTALVARTDTALAILAACSAALIGLGAGWYFIGIAAPYRMLALETVPRVVGTLVGIAAMREGAGPAAGLWGQLGGMLVGVLAPTVWICATTGGPRQWARLRRPLPQVLRHQVTGVATSITSATYTALPIVIVGLTSSAALPLFAVLDKLQKQVYVAVTPVVSLLQGWVPRAAPHELTGRVRTALRAGAAFCGVLGLGLLLATPWLVDWLGAGHFDATLLASVLVSAVVATNLFESIVSRVALVPLGQLGYVARVTAIGSIIGLVLVVPGTLIWGATGALAAMLSGLLIRVGAGLVRIARTPAPVSAAPGEIPTDVVETLEVTP